MAVSSRANERAHEVLQHIALQSRLKEGGQTLGQCQLRRRVKVLVRRPHARHGEVRPPHHTVPPPPP
eukprot:COSAG01_NODE_50439_length_363_cov_1.147727_1_plen_66_part_10